MCPVPPPRTHKEGFKKLALRFRAFARARTKKPYGFDNDIVPYYGFEFKDSPEGPSSRCGATSSDVLFEVLTNGECMRNLVLFLSVVALVACSDTIAPTLTSVNRVALARKPAAPINDTIVIPPCDPVIFVDTVSLVPLVTDTTSACTNPQ